MASRSPIDGIDKYLASIKDEDVSGSSREGVAIWRIFIGDPFPLFNDSPEQELAGLYGLRSPWCIYAVNIPFRYIDPDCNRDGDIDLLMIPLDIMGKNLLAPLQIDVDFLPFIAFEVKVMILDKADQLKSKKILSATADDKKQRHNKKQAEKLCLMGFDHVALIYVVAAEPRREICMGIRSWVEAMKVADTAQEMLERMVYTETTDPFSTISFVLAGVPEGLENDRSAGSPPIFHNRILSNSLKPQVSVFRSRLTSTLKKILPPTITANHCGAPSNIPIVLACSNTKCQNVFATALNKVKTCPTCGSLPL